MSTDNDMAAPSPQRRMLDLLIQTHLRLHIWCMEDDRGLEGHSFNWGEALELKSDIELMLYALAEKAVGDGE